MVWWLKKKEKRILKNRTEYPRTVDNKSCNTYVMRIPGGEKEEKVTEEISDVNMGKVFQNK